MFLKDRKAADPSPHPRPGETAQGKIPGVPSIISVDLKIVGNLRSSGDIQIDGTVVGDIDSRCVTVGERATVEGAVTAETARILGTVNGQIKAESVILNKTAKVTGDVFHKNLTVEAGAFLEGGVRRLQASRPIGATVAPLRPAHPISGAR